MRGGVQLIVSRVVLEPALQHGQGRRQEWRADPQPFTTKFLSAGPAEDAAGRGSEAGFVHTGLMSRLLAGSDVAHNVNGSAEISATEA